MDDKYFLNDLLASEKSMTINMAIALNEASCSNIYKKYFKIFCDVSDAQKDLFNLAYTLGYYTLEEADTKKIKTQIDTMNNDLDTIK